MSIEVRQADPACYSDLEQLCQNKPYYDSIFLDAEGLRKLTSQTLKDNLTRLPELENVRVLVAFQEGKAVGYLVLVLHTLETITQELQTLVFDFYAPGYAVLEPLIQAARQLTQEQKDDWLVVHILAPAKKEQLWFYRLGFRAELNRTVKKIPPGYQGPSSERYRARAAQPQDQLFILRVNAEHAASYRPHGRDTDPQKVRAVFLSTYGSLDMRDPGWRFIILEDVVERKPAAYLILTEENLPVPGQRGFYTYDVAAAPEYYGRGLSLYLAGAGESVVGEAGGGFLYGDSNPTNLAVVNGDRTLGYLLDSQRWGLDCRNVTLL